MHRIPVFADDGDGSDQNGTETPKALFGEEIGKFLRIDGNNLFRGCVVKEEH